MANKKLTGLGIKARPRRKLDDQGFLLQGDPQMGDMRYGEEKVVMRQGRRTLERQKQQYRLDPFAGANGPADGDPGYEDFINKPHFKWMDSLEYAPTLVLEDATKKEKSANELDDPTQRKKRKAATVSKAGVKPKVSNALTIGSSGGQSSLTIAPARSVGLPT